MFHIPTGHFIFKSFQTFSWAVQSQIMKEKNYCQKAFFILKYKKYCEIGPYVDWQGIFVGDDSY